MGSSSFVVGDHLGKDAVVEIEACDHVQSLLKEFGRSVRDHGGTIDPEWSKRSLCTHTIMCAIFESAMRGGKDVGFVPTVGDGTSFLIDGESFEDLPTRDWHNTAD